MVSCSTRIVLCLCVTFGNGYDPNFDVAVTTYIMDLTLTQFIVGSGEKSEMDSSQNRDIFFSVIAERECMQTFITHSGILYMEF
jgi:hypothetical protein